ncbi:MAG: hypothetical protein KatS3mg110_2618 [Pirellulaceae bacterium]|nr:MAG: hypothetical protein KatS3mg110_2618 [Pirellulaceae bacterium]
MDGKVGEGRVVGYDGQVRRVVAEEREVAVLRARLTCRCGNELWVEAAQAGSRITCRCGSTIEVPTLRVLKQLAAPETVAPATTAAAGQRVCSTSRWIQTGAFVLAALAIGWGAAAGALWFARFQIDTRRTPDDYRRAGHEAIDRMTPEEAFALWRYYRDQGLEHEEVPEPLRNWAVTTRLSHWAGGASAAAVLLALAAVTAGVLAARCNSGSSSG